MRITRVCHEPLDHVLAWLQVVSTADTLDNGTRIGKLVCGHAMIFAAELDAVLDFEWTSVLNLGMSRASASDASEAEIFTLVVQLSTSHSSVFPAIFVASSRADASQGLVGVSLTRLCFLCCLSTHLVRHRSENQFKGTFV